MHKRITEIRTEFGMSIVAPEHYMILDTPNQQLPLMLVVLAFSISNLVFQIVIYLMCH